MYFILVYVYKDIYFDILAHLWNEYLLSPAQF